MYVPSKLLSTLGSRDDRTRNSNYEKIVDYKSRNPVRSISSWYIKLNRGNDICPRREK